MRREPYTFVQPGGASHPIFHVADLGRRLVALAADRPLMLDVRGAPDALDALRIIAVPHVGRPELVGQVLRPRTPDLRNRVALAIALAESDRAAQRLRRVA